MFEKFEKMGSYLYAALINESKSIVIHECNDYWVINVYTFWDFVPNKHVNAAIVTDIIAYLKAFTYKPVLFFVYEPVCIDEPVTEQFFLKELIRLENDT